MINLTPHLTTAEQQQLGPLLMSDGATALLRTVLAGSSPGYADPAQFAPIVAKSVAGFVTSEYFKRSGWFRRQKVHVIAALSIGDDKTPTCHLLAKRNRRIVVAPAEVDLPPDYFDRRLLEELRVECGIPEAHDAPKGRCA